MAPTLLDPRRSWPARPFDLLLQACLLPDAEAHAAWTAWQAENDFDAISWSEIRLMVHLSGRIAELDPDSPLRPRIEGLARAHWTQNQVKLRGLIEIADLLAPARIPILVFKGAAVHVESMTAMRRRIMGDVDILVPENQVSRALELMLDAGWESVSGDSREYLAAACRVRGGGNFRKGVHSEVDLHRFAFHYSHADPGPDAALWQRARRVQIMGRELFVPCPADSMVIGLVHAANSVGADWALDAAARLSAPGIDWTTLVDTARGRGLVPQVRGGLLYLKERLHQDVPDDVLRELARTPGDPLMQLQCWASARPDGTRSWLARAISHVATRLLPRRGYRMAHSDRAAIAVRRNRSFWRLLPRRAVAAQPGPADSLQRDFTLPPDSAGKTLFVDVALKPYPTSRRVFFDISADGVGFARLRARIGGRNSAGYRLSFAVPLPPRVQDGARLKIEARPVAFLAPQLAAEQRDLLAALPFNLLAVGLIG